MDKKLAVILIGVIFLGIVGLGSIWFLRQQEQSSPEAPELKNITIQLKWQHQAQFAGLYAAQELGLYQQRGLQVTLRNGGPNIPPIPAVASGEAQFGVAGADDVLVAVANGEPVQALAAISQESPVVYFALEDSNIKTPYDFIGKKVGVREGTGTYLTYIAMLNNLSIDRRKIEEVPAITSDITPLLNKEVDVLPGFRTNEPKIAQRMGYPVSIIKPEDYGVDIYADVLITRKDMIARDLGLVNAFVQATLEGWEWAAEHQQEATDMVMKYATGTTREHQRDMLEETILLIKRTPTASIGQMSFSKWNRTYTLLRQYGAIPHDIDVSKAYTIEFLK